MPSSTRPSLVDFATEILHSATSLQEQLSRSNLPQPTLDKDGRQTYQDIMENPAAMEARSKLIETSRTLLTLAQGPIEALRVDSMTNLFYIAALRAIHQLKIAEAVPPTGDISITELAEKVKVHPDPLRRILRFAFTKHYFCEPEGKPDFIEHTSLSRVIEPFDAYLWFYLGDAAQTIPCALQFANSLKNWPRSPLDFADRASRDFWTIIQEDEPNGGGMERFSKAMTESMWSTQGDTNSLLRNGFDWEGLGAATVVDVGGGNGHNVILLAKAFPRLEFVVQDMKKNENPASELFQLAGLTESRRFRFQVHDFFEPQPSSSDTAPKAYLLSKVLHDWSDEDAARILKNLVPNIKRHGSKLVVVERVLPDNPGCVPLHYEAQLRALDMVMYRAFGAARERSSADWESLFRAVDEGLRIKAISCPVGSELSVLEVGMVEV